jgi:ABC-2 type transport system permease protein
MLPPSILIWGILFFLAGYALYGSLMAGLGALVPNLREASQATIFVVIPMVIPLVLLSPIIENPNGALAITFSLIPFTAPITMMTRLSAGSVPIWQSLLSLVLIFTTTYFVIRSVAGFFKATNLLSGSAFNFKRFVRAFISKN